MLLSQTYDILLCPFHVRTVFQSLVRHSLVVQSHTMMHTTWILWGVTFHARLLSSSPIFQYFNSFLTLTQVIIAAVVSLVTTLPRIPNTLAASCLNYYLKGHFVVSRPAGQLPSHITLITIIQPSIFIPMHWIFCTATMMRPIDFNLFSLKISCIVSHCSMLAPWIRQVSSLQSSCCNLVMVLG